MERESEKLRKIERESETESEREKEWVLVRGKDNYLYLGKYNEIVFTAEYHNIFIFIKLFL